MPRKKKELEKISSELKLIKTQLAKKEEELKNLEKLTSEQSEQLKEKTSEIKILRDLLQDKHKKIISMKIQREIELKKGITLEDESSSLDESTQSEIDKDDKFKIMQLLEQLEGIVKVTKAEMREKNQEKMEKQDDEQLDIKTTIESPSPRSDLEIIEMKQRLHDLIELEKNGVKLDDEKEKQAIDYLERLKSNIKKFTSIYKRIRLKELAEKCNCSTSKLRSILEDLIDIKEVSGFISGEFFIHHSLTFIEEFIIKNNCEFCTNFDPESFSCLKLNEKEINSLIEKNELCSFYERVEKELQIEDIRDLQKFLKYIENIELEELAKRYGISTAEIESLITKFLKEGIIKGEISQNTFIHFREIDYDGLAEYQPETGNLCGICYRPTEYEPLKCENCNTVYHRECIKRYVKEYNRCPICAAIFTNL